MRIYLAAADQLAPKARAELTQLLDEYDGKVEQEFAIIEKEGGSWQSVLERTVEVGEDWKDNVLDKWLTANPDAQEAIDAIANTFDAMFETLGEDRAKLVEAAVRAGLPPSKQSHAREIVDDAYDAFRAYSERIFKLQQEGGRLPETDPRFLEGVNLISDFELEKLRAVASIRDKLRELIPRERHAQFDAELAKLAGN